MNQMLKKESSFSFGLLVTVFTIVTLYEFRVSSMMILLGIGLCAMLFIGFCKIIWNESPKKPELSSMLLISKSVYLLGSGSLLLLTTYQIYTQNLDLWMPLTFGGMILSKAVNYISG